MKRKKSGKSAVVGNVRTDISLAVQDIGTAAEYYSKRGWWLAELQGYFGGKCTCGNSKCEHPGQHPFMFDENWYFNKKWSINQSLYGKGDIGDDDYSEKEGTGRNIAVGLGAQYGLAVLAVEPDGFTSLREAAKRYGDIPPAPRAKRGEVTDLYFSCPITTPTCMDILEDVHLLADGEEGWSILPPSLLPSGKVRWISGYEPQRVKMSDLPIWLVALADSRNGKSRIGAGSK